MGAIEKVDGKIIRCLRPFHVKSLGRQLCLCWCCLRWDCMVGALFACRKMLRDKNMVQQLPRDPKVNIREPHALHKAMTCCHEELPKQNCRDGSCENCGGGKKLDALLHRAESEAVPTVSWMKWSRLEHKDATGANKTKCDFQRVTTGIEELLAEIRKQHATHVLHLTILKNQSRDWKHVRRNFPKGHFVSVQDFSENLCFEVKCEFQSKHYCQVGCTPCGAVLCVHLVTFSVLVK